MTSLAMMQLVDAGPALARHAVQQYLPWFSIGGGSAIDVGELLSHTAGIPDDFRRKTATSYDVATLRRAQRYSSHPGTWMVVFQRRVRDRRRDSREPRRAAVERFSAGPGLRPHRDDEQFAGLHARRDGFAAVGYQWRDNDRPGTLHPPLVASPAMDFVDPAGSVLSTPEDMARYMRLYLNGGKTESGTQLISPAAFTTMTTAARLNDGKPAGSETAVLEEAPEFYRQYGLGLSVFDSQGDHLVGHTGGISGYTACMQMNLTRGFGVVAMANLVEAPLHPCAIVLYAMRVLRAQSAGEPIPPPPVAPDPAHVAGAAAYDGAYTAPAQRR